MASNQINGAKEERASLKVVAVNLATNESNQALMAANRGIRVGADHDLDTFTMKIVTQRIMLVKREVNAP